MALDEKPIEEMSLKELAAYYNSLAPGKYVKKFKDRATGLKRIRSLLEEQGPPTPTRSGPKATEEGATQESADAPASSEAQGGAAAPAQTRKRLEFPEDPDGDIKPHRPNTRRGQVIRMCATEEGATLSELVEATGWIEQDVRTTLKLINLDLGHGVEEDEDGRIRITGEPKSRKPFYRKPKKEIKPHRPGTKRARVVEMLQREEGASFAEIMEETNWNRNQAYQGITLIHAYLGYGLTEDEDGRIRITEE